MPVRYFYIYDNKATTIPLKQVNYTLKKDDTPSMPELANTNGLVAAFFYTKEKIINVTFFRIRINEDGRWNFKDSIYADRTYIITALKYLNYSLGLEIEPLPEAIKPCIPTDNEINIIKSFINAYYPFLLRNDVQCILEDKIRELEEEYANNIMLFKRSHTLYSTV